MPRFELNQRVKLADHYIGKDDPVYIVAEMSANHLQDYERAKKIILAAKESGADAIKLQSYRPDTITIVQSYPHTKVGKIDYRLLEKMAQDYVSTANAVKKTGD